MKHFVMVMVAAALCFLGVVFSAPRAEAYLTNDTADSIYAAHGSDALTFCKNHGYGSDHYICFICSSSSTPSFPDGLRTRFCFFFFDSETDIRISGNNITYSNGKASSSASYIIPSNGDPYWTSSGRYDSLQFSNLPEIFNSDSSISVMGYTSSWWYFVDAQGVDLYYNDVLVNPSWSSPDMFWVHPQGWDITYEAYPSENSSHDENCLYYWTLDYTVRISFDRNDINNYSVTIPYYPFYSAESSSAEVMTVGDVHVWHAAFFQSVQSRYREIRYFPDAWYDNTAPPAFSDLVNPQSSPLRINFNDLLKLFQKEHPDNALVKNDLLNVLTVEFIDCDTGNVAYTGTVDYSSFHVYSDTDPEPFIPEPASSDVDWTEDPETQEDKLLNYFQAQFSQAGVAFRSASSPELTEEPFVSDFDFNLYISNDAANGAGFARTFFEKVVSAAGLDDFLIIVLIIAVASWFVFGPLR